MDFRVKNGLAVTTTATVEGTLQSTSTNSGALTVAGGVGIGGNLNVNNSATILSTAFNTGTLAANALYVAGGVGIGKTLLVTGDAIFQSNVTFSGTSTYVYSTNTVYTDNLINIHVPVGSTGTNHTWAVDDGKDVGFIYHYYSGTDKDAFLGLSNSSKYLEWYSDSVETNGIVTSATYGTFKTGSIILTDTTASTTTGTGALIVAGGVGIGGDLRVGGTIFGYASVTGIITTATNIAAGTAGQLVYQSAVGTTSFAGPGTAGQVLVSNGTSQPVYRSNVSLSIVTATSIVVTSTQSSTSSFSSNALYVAGGIGGNSGFNINGDGYLHGDLTIFGTITGTDVTLNLLIANSGTFYGDASGSGALYAGVLGYTPFAQTMAQFTGDLNDYMEINVQNINAGNWASTDIIASADNVTESSAFIDMGITSSGWDGTAPSTFADNLGPNDGYLLVGETDAPGAGHLVIGTLATSTTVKIVVAGTNSNYLTALFDTRNTESISTETGSLVVYGGLGVGGNIYIGGSETILGDIDIRGGDLTTNQSTFNLLNSTATTLNFAGSGTAITIGATTGYTAIRNATTITNTTAATSTSTGALRVYGGVGIGGNLYVGGSIVSPGGITGVVSTATNIAGGRPGFIPIQSAIGITAFINTGSVGNVLQMQVGNTATFVSTSTLQVGYSVTATNIAGGLSGQLHYQTAPGATSFVNTGTAGNVLVSNGTSAPTYNNTLTLTGTAISLSTTTGALQVAGGIGVGDSIYVENRVGFVNTSNVSVVYQFYNAATNSLDTVFG